MTEYRPMPGPSEPQRSQPRPEPPASIRRAVTLVWTVVALSVVNSILTFVFLNDMVAAMVDAPGAAGLDEGTARASVLFGVVFNIVFVVLWVVLGIFLGRGANWARIVITVLAGIGVVFGLIGLGSGAGANVLFQVVGVVTLLAEIALLYFLWQKESGAFLKPRPTY